MTKCEITSFAKTSLAGINLAESFTIEWEENPNRGGAVSYVRGEYRGILYLSNDLELVPLATITGVVLHEIAHCIDVSQRGFTAHDARWREIVRKIGGDEKEVIDLYGIFC